MTDYRVNGQDTQRLNAFLSDNAIDATTDDRLAEGLWVVSTADLTTDQITALAVYSDAYVPQAVKTAVAFLKQRAAAGDNVAKASLALFKYINARLD